MQENIKPNPIDLKQKGLKREFNMLTLLPNVHFSMVM